MVQNNLLFQTIATSIRDDILSKRLKAGELLPSVREMAQKWHCAPGTMVRAYKELSRQGLVISHSKRGTRVSDQLPDQNQTPIRRAMLLNRTETFLLESISAGYAITEVEQTLRIALDHWRTYISEPVPAQPNVLRFVGSHDPAVALMADRYHKIAPNFSLHLTFTGSLGGLIALAEKNADLAGCHLWDEDTNTYNVPFVHKLLPGQKVVLLTIAHRYVGLIFQSGNPLGIHSLNDLTKVGVRIVNRQQGSGTRVWLDAQMRRAGINPSNIAGYDDEKMTHSDVALAISNGSANIGLGVESAALAFGLGFKKLVTERYDLVIPADKWEMESIQALKRWLIMPQSKSAISSLGGYDTHQTGKITWIT